MNNSKNIIKIFFLFVPFFTLLFFFKITYAETVDISVFKTRFVFSSNEETAKSVFILKNPSRLVIDFEDIDKFIKNDIDYKYIKDIRASKKNKISRLVFDINFLPKNFRAIRVFNVFKDKNNLVVDLGEFKKKYIIKKNITVVIDPGHGGADPGAVRGNIKEKKLTLNAAKILKKQLELKGFDVILTRDKDVFISLRNRVRIARKHSGDLFISLHADSTRNKGTKGTSIYSLSEKASDKLAKELADRENKSDLIGGIDLENVEKDVSDILIDLSRRETKNSSIEFAELFVLIFEKNDIKLLRRPHRQAGFAVLKAPDIPSVLVEMGFMSNNSDLEKLSKKKYLTKLMEQVGLVVEKYFLDNPK